MACKRKYRCATCHYEADVYEGKGLFGQHITALSCPDCLRIENIVVGGVIGDVAPSFSSETGRLCLRCGSDRARVWDLHTCPRCGGEMQVMENSEEFWT